MTPVERMQAAIEKLEALKGESTPGIWRAWDSFSSDRAPRCYITGNNSGPSDGNRVARIENRDSQDAELIEALHRTIDAQLAILRFGLERQYAVDWMRRTFAANDKQLEAAGLELALADAILGHHPAPALSDREFAEVARFGIHPELGEGS